jgi:hypothetical protein
VGYISIVLYALNSFSPEPTATVSEDFESIPSPSPLAPG